MHTGLGFCLKLFALELVEVCFICKCPAYQSMLGPIAGQQFSLSPILQIQCCYLNNALQCEGRCYVISRRIVIVFATLFIYRNRLLTFFLAFIIVHIQHMKIIPTKQLAENIGGGLGGGQQFATPSAGFLLMLTFYQTAGVIVGLDRLNPNATFKHCPLPVPKYIFQLSYTSYNSGTERLFNNFAYLSIWGSVHSDMPRSRHVGQKQCCQLFI